MGFDAAVFDHRDFYRCKDIFSVIFSSYQHEATGTYLVTHKNCAGSDCRSVDSNDGTVVVLALRVTVRMVWMCGG